MNQITHLPLEEQIIVLEREGAGQNRATRPEQKSAAGVKDIVRTFSQPVHVVLDPCVGTFATAKACMMLPRHRRFIGCEMDTGCCHKSCIYMVETILRQGLNQELDFTG